ncbi:sugar ABC transporter substrate-binding protein [Streptomyces iconiensis]|uniref:Sugar ABC transporter substrate-binding protein n=1 Tax=Streptomyces iconiensis TaxID=1384038 RepID=A0ABT6ZW30_9ACTN|nr:sugar ABC transporter substrate-binding protein [Streptomyces iconiensis]MDJ1132821.1 sugar ABC transporter substrate-binding protein [Streptomyces iconiensis]
MAHRRTTATAVTLAAVALLAAGCSSSGGKKSAADEGDDGGAQGGGTSVGTPRLTIAMVTHSGEGDTFWDIVQSGAKQAARKDNVRFDYANHKDAGQQAQLVQTAIDKKVDGLIVTLAKPDALKAVIGKAVRRGIPVITINSGAEHSAELGALAHIGQDETVAGEAVGEELNARAEAAKGTEATEATEGKALCVIHEQGNVSLEERCAGAKKTFKGTLETLNVDGTNMPGVQSSVEAKLQSDKDVDTVVTLGAPFAATSAKAKEKAGSAAEVVTFDLNAQVVKEMKAKRIGFAVDQQPYMQGYEAVDLLWLHRYNLNSLGGGKPVLTGPEIVTRRDVPRLEKYTERGTR